MSNLTGKTGMENWSILDCHLLWAFEDTLTPEQRQIPHVQNAFYPFYLHQGETTITYRSSQETFGPGQWIFPKIDEGKHHFSDDVRLLAVRFNVKWPSEVSLFDRDRTVAFSGKESEGLTRTAKRMVQFIAKHSLLGYKRKGSPVLTGSLSDYIRLQPFFYHWIEAFYQAYIRAGYDPIRFGPVSERMRPCIRYMRHRLLSTPFYERELADLVGISVSQICKIFVQEIGVTPQSYWNTRRLHAAKMELSNTDRSIKEIAFSLGFSSPEHFARWFAKIVGTSPREYRSIGDTT